MNSASVPSKPDHPSANLQPQSDAPPESAAPETPQKPTSSRGVLILVAVVVLLVVLWQVRIALRQGPSDVIQAQLDAFNRGDFGKAYSYAATGIKQKMPLEAFRAMIETGYPQFAKSKEAHVGQTRVSGDSAVVAVTLIGKDNVTVHALYLMDRESGGWKVAGVQVDRWGPASKRGKSV